MWKIWKSEGGVRHSLRGSRWGLAVSLVYGAGGLQVAELQVAKLQDDRSPSLPKGRVAGCKVAGLSAEFV